MYVCYTADWWNMNVHRQQTDGRTWFYYPNHYWLEITTGLELDSMGLVETSGFYESDRRTPINMVEFTWTTCMEEGNILPEQYPLSGNLTPNKWWQVGHGKTVTSIKLDLAPPTWIWLVVHGTAYSRKSHVFCLCLRALAPQILCTQALVWHISCRCEMRINHSINL